MTRRSFPSPASACAVSCGASATALTLALTLTTLTGCQQDPSGGGGDAVPSFTLAWSEYPSWSVFGVAELRGLIDGAKGKLGTVEQAHGVDIVLQETDYDTCITMYASGTADAVCITNMDILNPALTIDSVAILPTSTSNGADALIVTGIDDVASLRGKKVYGLEKSVSEYTFVRNLEQLGEDPGQHAFTNMDPAAAAQAMITRQDGYEAIVVWNPFVLETLKKRPDARVMFDSASIPGEIVDMVVATKSSLAKPGGDAFATAVVDAFYQVNAMIDAPATRDATLVALGAKFSSLELEAMKRVVEQTVFYRIPEQASGLFESKDFRMTMDRVVGFCMTQDIIDRQPALQMPGESGPAQLEFTTRYVTAAADGNR